MSNGIPLAFMAMVLSTAVMAAAVAVVLAQRQPQISDQLASQSELEDEDENGEPPEGFREAAERVKSLSVSDTETLLKLYGLFKRVTVGLAQAKDKPWEPTARAKWFAWNDCRDLTRQEAALLYIELVKTLDHGAGSTAKTESKKPSMGPKVSKMVATEESNVAVEFAGSEVFDEVREDFSKLEDRLRVLPDLVKLRDEEQRTLLHWAVDGDCLSAVITLLEHGAEIDAVDSEGFTALGYAASSDLSELASFLVNAGANVEKASTEKAAFELTRDPELKEELRKALRTG